LTETLNDGDIKQRGFAPELAQDVLEVMDFSQSECVAASAQAWMKADLDTPIELQGTRPRYRHCLIDVSESGKPK
jgi:hypothetical protein